MFSNRQKLGLAAVTTVGLGLLALPEKLSFKASIPSVDLEPVHESNRFSLDASLQFELESLPSDISSQQRKRTDDTKSQSLEHSTIVRSIGITVLDKETQQRVAYPTLIVTILDAGQLEIVDGAKGLSKEELRITPIPKYIFKAKGRGQVVLTQEIVQDSAFSARLQEDITPLSLKEILPPWNRYPENTQEVDGLTATVPHEVLSLEKSRVFIDCFAKGYSRSRQEFEVDLTKSQEIVVELSLSQEFALIIVDAVTKYPINDAHVFLKSFRRDGYGDGFLRGVTQADGVVISDIDETRAARGNPFISEDMPAPELNFLDDEVFSTDTFNVFASGYVPVRKKFSEKELGSKVFVIELSPGVEVHLRPVDGAGKTLLAPDSKVEIYHTISYIKPSVFRKEEVLADASGSFSIKGFSDHENSAVIIVVEGYLPRVLTHASKLTSELYLAPWPKFRLQLTGDSYVQNALREADEVGVSFTFFDTHYPKRKFQQISKKQNGGQVVIDTAELPPEKQQRLLGELLDGARLVWIDNEYAEKGKYHPYPSYPAPNSKIQITGIGLKSLGMPIERLLSPVDGDSLLTPNTGKVKQIVVKRL